jgi:hypothetical protein
MATLLLKVHDVFAITGRGLVIVPGPLEAEYSGPRKFTVRLKLPDGQEYDASMTLEFVFQTPPPKERRYACLLLGLSKADVPIGTEVWAEVG